MSKYDGLGVDELIRLLQRRDAERQLGLVWERDEIEEDRALNADYVALSMDAGASHGHAPWGNLIIEGDNFDALRALRASHRGLIRCIYIDPPYNTGNKDFVYNDKFVDRTHRFRHSLWLEFMYRRLQIAKELLADDGVIFVSIDDNEMFRLGMLLDKVFGQGNKLAVFTWQTDGNFDNQAKIKIAHEYVLAYAKVPDKFPMPPVVDPNVPEASKLFKTEIRNTIIKNGPRNPVSAITLPKGFPAAFREGVVEARNDARWPRIRSRITVKDGIVQAPVTVESGWANKAKCLEFIDGGFRPIKDTKGQDTRFELTQSGAIENVKVRSASHVVSVLRNMGNTQSDSAALADMGIRFTYPKPVQLLQYLISLVADDSATVLDFFAGSGSTAHAVAKLNAEDGGDRKFILISNTEATKDDPDKNLCRDVCAERVRRILGGYEKAKGGKVEGFGGGFAYLRARRIQAHRLALKIEHGEVWNTLQMLHMKPLTVWTKNGFTVDGDIAYLPDFHERNVHMVRAWLLSRDTTQMTLYSWVPSRAADLVDSARDVRCLPIPDHLRERFGR